LKRVHARIGGGGVAGAGAGARARAGGCCGVTIRSRFFVDIYLLFRMMERWFLLWVVAYFCSIIFDSNHNYLCIVIVVKIGIIWLLLIFANKR
jgi:hypothetical protein